MKKALGIVALFFGLVCGLVCGIPASADTVTALDGRLSKCEIAHDIGNSGWVLRNAEVMPAPELSVVLNADAVYMECKADLLGAVAWTEGRVLEPVKRASVDGTEYDYWTDRNEFLVTNRSAIILSSDPSTAGAPTVTINHVYKLENALTPADLKALTAGEPVRVFLTVFPRGISFYQLPGQKAVPLGTWAGGAYAVRFNAQLVNGALKITRL